MIRVIFDLFCGTLSIKHCYVAFRIAESNDYGLAKGNTGDDPKKPIEQGMQIT